jgi:hypothetical protein
MKELLSHAQIGAEKNRQWRADDGFPRSAVSVTGL